MIAEFFTNPCPGEPRDDLAVFHLRKLFPNETDAIHNAGDEQEADALLLNLYEALQAREDVPPARKESLLSWIRCFRQTCARPAPRYPSEHLSEPFAGRSIPERYLTDEGGK
jgi:hypothetical protein